MALVRDRIGQRCPSEIARGPELAEAPAERVTAEAWSGGSGCRRSCAPPRGAFLICFSRSWISRMRSATAADLLLSARRPPWRIASRGQRARGSLGEEGEFVDGPAEDGVAAGEGHAESAEGGGGSRGGRPRRRSGGGRCRPSGARPRWRCGRRGMPRQRPVRRALEGEAARPVEGVRVRGAEGRGGRGGAEVDAEPVARGLGPAGGPAGRCAGRRRARPWSRDGAGGEREGGGGQGADPRRRGQGGLEEDEGRRGRAADGHAGRRRRPARRPRRSTGSTRAPAPGVHTTAGVSSARGPSQP